MKTFLIALSASAALAAAAPAAAQIGVNSNVNANAGVNLQNRIAQLDTRLQAGIQSGAITQTEARSLRQQVRELRRLERQYSRNGLTQAERQDLQQRLRTTRQQFRMADNGGNGRWNDNDDYAYGQAPYGQQQQPYYGQQGQQPYYGQGGPYEEVTEACESRSGGGIVGQIFGSILGGSRNDCLEVGERATGNLMAVPYQYQSQFRDGNGIVYRSDGQRVYQIDARTSTVLRVYAIR
jgi:hypothetical protein